jgi:DNA-binding response OmpR family regulator
MKVLVVEDSRPQRLEDERVLNKAGYRVIAAEDGETALRLAVEEKPDAIILDLMLPKLSGVEVLKRLKDDARTAAIPVIVLSGLSQKNADKLIDEGAEAYFEKNEVMPDSRHNRLPRVLEDVICRVNRKRGILLSSIPIPKS